MDRTAVISVEFSVEFSDAFNYEPTVIVRRWVEPRVFDMLPSVDQMALWLNDASF